MFLGRCRNATYFTADGNTRVKKVSYKKVDKSVIKIKMPMTCLAFCKKTNNPFLALYLSLVIYCTLMYHQKFRFNALDAHKVTV